MARDVRDARHRVSIRATVLAHGRECTATITDVSGGGMLLEISGTQQIDRGDEVEVAWSDGLRVFANVRHVRAEGDQLIMGVRFTSMPESAWLAIHSMLIEFRQSTIA